MTGINETLLNFYLFYNLDLDSLFTLVLSLFSIHCETPFDMGAYAVIILLMTILIVVILYGNNIRTLHLCKFNMITQLFLIAVLWFNLNNLHTLVILNFNMITWFYLIGVFNLKNMLLILICILQMVICNIILGSLLGFDDILGQIYAIYIIAVAGAESAIGLSILVAFYRLRGSTIFNSRN